MTLKIGHKLLIAILATNLLLAAGFYVLGDLSFSRSFRDYLDNTVAERLAPLVTVLGEEYRRRGNWDWVRDRDDPTWPRLLHRQMREGMMQNRDTDPPPGLRRPFRGDFERRPPPGDIGRPSPPGMMGINPRLFLADSQNRLVLGDPAKQNDTYWIPIPVDGNTVGYIGFTRRAKITDDLDRLFRDRLRASLGWIVAGMTLVASLAALLLARRMVRPIHELRSAARALASGDYSVSITPRSGDELGELAQDFNALATTLEKNLKARQQWVADISHELRTPVAILQGEIEALRDGVRPWSPKAVESLFQETRRLARLVGDLHELSLSDLGALSYQKQEVDLPALLHEVIEQHRAALDAKFLKVDVQAGQRTVMLHGDAERLRQLFSNLLNNSIFYTDSGGRIAIDITADRYRVRLTWADSAPGVRDADLPRLFDRLFRAEASRNRNSGGSGLGLAIVKNIVEAHHGTVRARHSPLGGLAFDIEFRTAGA
ncbi:MAG: ATP-binding protein [Gammaproteobacteria bacterium]|nr:ATP-binding protein [Gammaproteobacteria bacterium]